ncbi:MAG TPA: VanZ family protein [Roseimicrobium sp.]|nr:VanZ family protein [Roseimicrobium sp.]
MPRVSRVRIAILYWLPAALWMVLIFSASTDAMSAPHTSRFTGPILHWLFPGIDENTVGLIQVGIRKTAHLTEYAILAWLLWRALWIPVPGDRRPWNRKVAYQAIALAAAYAATDEFHQSFVPSRGASPVDVLIDTAGAVIGIYLVHRWHAWRQRRLATR